MTLTQEFKNQCEQLLTQWQQLIGEKWHWGETTWPVLVKQVKDGKEKILKDQFFLSFKDRSEEEQKWMLKRIEYWYNTPSFAYVEPYAALYYCINSVSGATGDGTAELAVNIFQLKNDFLKMIDVDKWATAEQASQAIADKSKAEQERDTAKTNLNKLTEEWNIDFKTDFGNELTAESLKLVKEKLKNQANATPQPLNDYWGNNFSEFGDKLDADTLTKIKGQLDALKAENDSFKEKQKINDQEDFITKRDNTIKAQEIELSKKNDIIAELNKKIKKLENKDLQALQVETNK